MMKANLKGFSGIKGLLLLHGEKIAIAAVGICTLLFIYYSTRLERLDDKYQASNLQQQVSLTRSDIEAADWNSAVSEHADEVRVAKQLAKNGVQEVDPTLYPFRGVDPPVIQPTELRTDPVLLVAVDPRATGGSGLLPFLDERVMRERQLAKAAADEQKAKQEADMAAKQADLQDNERGRNQRGRGRDDEGMNYEVDPEHPNRRPVEGVTHAPGAQVMGDERVELESWAIVVAKVPIKEQLKLYRDSFENTRTGFDPQYDFPRYVGYLVQRTEVLPDQELQWVNVDVEDGQGNKMAAAPGKPAPVNQATMNKLYETIQKIWAAQIPEPVDPRYLDSEGLLAFPLPPLLGRDWGAEVTHPDIPLAINAPPPEEEMEPELEVPAQPPGVDDDGGFGHSADPGMNNFSRPGGRAMPGRGAFRGGSMDDELGGRGGFRGGPMMRGGRGAFMGGELGGRGALRGGGMVGATVGMLPRGVDSWLLRFIDFSVEPGKKYKYRVRLVLDDPNSNASNPTLLAKSLDPSVLNRLREAGKGRPNNRPPTFRFAEWSEPSPTVGIPLSGSVRLATVKAANDKLYNDEPTATLLVESFEKDEKGNAIHAAKKKELRRGSVANMVEETEYLVADGRSIDKKDSFKFWTGITVVDMAGGEKLTRDMQAPARVLLLDPSGELYIHNEMDDAEAVHMHDVMFTKPDKRKGSREEEGIRGGGFRSGRGER